VDRHGRPSLSANAQEHVFSAGVRLTSGPDTLAQYQRLQHRATELDPEHRMAALRERNLRRAWRILFVLLLLAAVLITWPHVPWTRWWALMETAE